MHQHSAILTSWTLSQEMELRRSQQCSYMLQACCGCFCRTRYQAVHERMHRKPVLHVPAEIFIALLLYLKSQGMCNVVKEPESHGMGGATCLAACTAAVQIADADGAKGLCRHTTPQALTLRLLYHPGRPSAHCAACCTSSSLQAPDIMGPDAKHEQDALLSRIKLLELIIMRRCPAQ